MDAVDDVIETTVHEFVVNHGELAETVKEPLALGQVTVKDLQQILSGPSDTYIEQIMKHMTRMCNKGDRVTGVLYSRSHVKKLLP